ncbi:MAG: class I adenylate-forming enzyme family protein [Chloroherpetonaceae bacterium]|nr:acyl--CoA ligase [Chloroherpetonaceae bacterium]MDW8019974.1 class I adenylate-forming enzyme family protein [Chloroherpetonaceae bacterium]
MNKDLLFNAHMAHAVIIDGQTYLPTNYLVPYRNILELLTARAKKHKNDTFITFYASGGVSIRYTYDEFRRKVFQTANYLRAQGLIEESRVATISHNHIDTVVQYFAAWCAGITVVPINVGETPERIRYILENAEVSLAFVRDEYLPMVQELGLRITLLPSSEFEETISAYPDTFEQAQITDTRVQSQPAVNDSQATYADLETEALIVYTSGTTGLPKGVVLTQYNLLVDADAIAKWHNLQEGDVMMCVLPIHHVNGTVVTLLTPLYYGGSVVLNQKFQTETFFERLANEKVKVVSVVPTLLQFLLHANIDLSRYDLSSFSHFICGAGPLTVELATNFEKRYGLKIIHGYGLSETTCYSCFLPLDLSDEEHTHWLSQYGFPSIGVPIPPNEMAIFNDRGEKVREGWRGEIVIRGHNVMKGYYKNEEANVKAFEKGWFHSGDEGFYKTDAQGRKFFFITGRLKELIIRGGVNISPLEIDEVLNAIPGVRSAIAVGFENDWYGEEVGALVQLKEGATLSGEDIIKECAKKLPFNKCPKVVIFTDSIPVTSTGKYQRNKVKDLFKQWKTVQFKQP